MTCNTCYGYGLHALGIPTPVGPIDASDGMPTKPCPECGANANPVCPYCDNDGYITFSLKAHESFQVECRCRKDKIKKCPDQVPSITGSMLCRNATAAWWSENHPKASWHNSCKRLCREGRCMRGLNE